VSRARRERSATTRPAHRERQQHAPDTARTLRGRGLRATASRRAVLEFLQRRGEHLAANEILDGLRRAGQRVSIATLYQNLQALSERGLLLRFAGADGHMRYDINLQAHHHLVCEGCGRIVDVEISGGDAARPVPAVAARSQPVRGWLVRDRRVEFRGLCPRCRRRASPAAARRSAAPR
jgi:Fe2+ or Zn2+ uptake regulation protein